MIKFCFYISCILLVGCSSSSRHLVSKNNKDLLLDSINFWYHKDFEHNEIPGISLEKWYSEKPKHVKQKIIVAVIDMQIDKNHEDLKGQLWLNKNEIPNNKKDDDNNGYVDDEEGWSFTGTKDGSYALWSNHEFIRIIRKYKNEFEGKKEEEINSERLKYYKEYIRAKEKSKEKIDYNKNWQKSLVFMDKVFPIAKDSLKKYFPKENYNIHQLDSIYNLKKVNDKSFNQRRDSNDNDIGALIDYMMAALELNQDHKKIIEQIIKLDSVITKSLNVDYNERKEIGDNENQFEKGYGNNNISDYSSKSWKLLYHNTRISGIIAGNRTNNKGILGFSNNIIIMPINISPMGDKHDKDIAMAIYYAVDNGAKIINMSFSKEFSANKELVFDALKYAEKHNVLVVNSAGNNGVDIDKFQKYPNDISYEDLNKEICSNYINVGATTNNANEKLVLNYSNYGKYNVDIFAPGYSIYMATDVNSYITDSGTSYSTPMVSGTAALIWLYYPKLTVQEVKQIILESGTSYDIDVLIPGGEGKKVAFKELSKSGKVLNVYNAMKMAKEMSKNK